MVSVAPSIQDLRSFQWGRETVRATDTLTIDTQPTAGDKFLIGAPVDSGTAESGTTTSLTDTDKAWIIDQWVGFVIYISGGTGIGQFLIVTANTATVLSFATATAPDNTSTYGLYRSTDLYTILTSGAANAGEINRGANLAGAQANIVAALNGSDGWNAPNPYISEPSAFTTNVLTLTSKSAGTPGNNVTTVESFTAGSNVFSATALSGGVDRGTFHAATSKMLVADWDAEPTDSVYHPPLLRGIIQRWKGGEIVTERGTKWVIPETPFFYEQAHNLGLMSIKGGVTPTGSSPYVWNFVRDPTGNPDLDSFTIERRLSDGVNFIDQRCAYNLISQITWKGAQNQPVMYTANGFGRRIKSHAFTAALTAPTGEAALASSSKIYINNTWGTLGNTQIVGQIMHWELMFMTGYEPLFTTDGRSDLDFTIASLSSENTQVSLKVTMLVTPGLGGQFFIEQAAAEAQTLRAVRVQCDGTASKQVQWDMLVKHNLGSLFKIGMLQGQDIVEMDFVESTDQTNLFAMKVTNLISSLT